MTPTEQPRTIPDDQWFAFCGASLVRVADGPDAVQRAPDRRLARNWQRKQAEKN